MKNLIEIEIKNWEKFNYRNDVKASSWFRFEHDFFDNDELDLMTNNDRLLWIYILCRASQRSNSAIKVSSTKIKHILGCNQKVLDDALSNLQELQLIILSRNGGGTDAVRTREITCATDRQTDRHIRDVTVFEALYKKYPKREPKKPMGKASGMRWLLNHKFTDDEFEKLELAVNAYAESKPEPKYVPMWSSFVRKFEDYLPENLSDGDPSENPDEPKRIFQRDEVITGPYCE